jgi:hypothetical protein
MSSDIQNVRLVSDSVDIEQLVCSILLDLECVIGSRAYVSRPPCYTSMPKQEKLHG